MPEGKRYDDAEKMPDYYGHHEVMVGTGFYKLPRHSKLRLSRNQAKSHHLVAEFGTCSHCRVNDVTIKDGFALHVDGFGDVCEECFKNLE